MRFKIYIVADKCVLSHNYTPTYIEHNCFWTNDKKKPKEGVDERKR